MHVRGRFEGGRARAWMTGLASVLAVLGVSACDDAMRTGPRLAAVGEACTAPASCASGICVAMSDTLTACTETCTGSETCPAGWSCEPFDDRRLCVCEGESCATVVLDAGRPRDAGPPNVDGGCPDGRCDCECERGAVEIVTREPCDTGGERAQTRTCGTSCTWGDPTWSACSAPGECVAGSRRCDGVCAECPTRGVAVTACDAAACVATECEAGFVACTGGCCAWSSEIVDDAGNAGRFASLALTASGTAVIAYSDLDRGAMRLARGTPGGPWSAVDVDVRGSTGAFASLVLDASGAPRLAYYTVDGSSLRVARESGGRFDIEAVDGPEAGRAGDAGWFTSIAMHPDGRERVAYYDYTARALRYASRGASGWSVTPLDAPRTGVGTHASLVLDGSGRPWIAYRDDTDRALRVAHYDGSRWVYELADGAGDPGTYTSIAISSSGEVRVAYFANGPKDLRLATRSPGGRWSSVDVATEGEVGTFASLAIGSDGLAHVAYRDVTRTALGYAHEREDGTFELAIVDDDGDVGEHPSIVLDRSGHALIAHRDVARGALRLTRQE